MSITHRWDWLPCFKNRHYALISRNYLFSAVSVPMCACHAVDNGTRGGLDKFLQLSSDSPSTVKHYEFMQDYQVKGRGRGEGEGGGLRECEGR